ncbi:MAG: citrate (Si)-synthase [Candidatus Marinimicrobia bacterium]|nr:citrate (Si)-synthase [Candidatus Neomarinimicrobiota bacterium]MCF7828523.1 citrate (Si)-synthase [Candidatus Neomarinimicrobiota bacterium]MCF7882054.1 citrate (Si)-synthase [Candidatus Neomarinimicrobiota bacterium]
MANIFDKMAAIRSDICSERSLLLTEKGDEQLDTVTVKQAHGGMRGVKAMICDTSLVEPDKGLIIRGYPLLEIKDLWPEDVFLLLLTGEKPTEEDRADLLKEYDKRAEIPDHVWDVLRGMAKDSHPMTMLSTGIMALENESVFDEKYNEGVEKTDYWKYYLEDALNLLAKLPGLAAGIYKIRFDKGEPVGWTKGLDWGANYAKMLGVSDKEDFTELMRLYLMFHCDHEGGNVSANTCHTVGSALSNAYYSVSAGLNGLAGFLHGMANQECLGWILEVMDKFDGTPSEDQLRDFAWETLKSGKVIPGYGHAVLRVTDPRFKGFLEFGKEHLPEDPVFKTVHHVYNVVPDVLKEFSEERVKAGKNPIGNPWPNVDAGSGSLLYHYGLTEFSYYTVLFGISRAMGMLSQLVLNRALGVPITRPKSVGTNYIKNNV